MFQARLGGAEGRVRALDVQLLQLEGAKKEVEQKLISVGSTLRRIAGIQFDGSVTLPYKLTSPSRRWSPTKGMDFMKTPLEEFKKINIAIEECFVKTFFKSAL